MLHGTKTKLMGHEVSKKVLSSIPGQDGSFCVNFTCFPLEAPVSITSKNMYNRIHSGARTLLKEILIVSGIILFIQRAHK